MPPRPSSAPPQGRPGSEQLQRLKRGEISFDEYLESRVERALAKIEGHVTAEQLEFLREMLRDQLLTNPLLRESVRRATGREPPLPSTR